MHHHAKHLLARGKAIYAGVVGYRLHVDEDIATHHALTFSVAIIEGYHIGEVIVTDEVDIHLAMYGRRTEDIGHIAQRVTLMCGHLPEPSRHCTLFAKAV